MSQQQEDPKDCRNFISYKQWSNDQTISWINNVLQGKLNQKQIETFKQLEVKGDILINLDQQDLYDVYDIKYYDQIHSILKEIKLFQCENNDQEQNSEEEADQTHYFSNENQNASSDKIPSKQQNALKPQRDIRNKFSQDFWKFDMYNILKEIDFYTLNQSIIDKLFNKIAEYCQTNMGSIFKYIIILQPSKESQIIAIKNLLSNFTQKSAIMFWQEFTEYFQAQKEQVQMQFLIDDETRNTIIKSQSILDSSIELLCNDLYLNIKLSQKLNALNILIDIINTQQYQQSLTFMNNFVYLIQKVCEFDKEEFSTQLKLIFSLLFQIKNKNHEFYFEQIKSFNFVLNNSIIEECLVDCLITCFQNRITIKSHFQLEFYLLTRCNFFQVIEMNNKKNLLCKIFNNLHLKEKLDISSLRQIKNDEFLDMVKVLQQFDLISQCRISSFLHQQIRKLVEDFNSNQITLFQIRKLLEVGFSQLVKFTNLLDIKFDQDKLNQTFNYVMQQDNKMLGLTQFSKLMKTLNIPSFQEVVNFVQYYFIEQSQVTVQEFQGQTEIQYNYESLEFLHDFNHIPLVQFYLQNMVKDLQQSQEIHILEKDLDSNLMQALGLIKEHLIKIIQYQKVGDDILLEDIIIFWNFVKDQNQILEESKSFHPRCCQFFLVLLEQKHHLGSFNYNLNPQIKKSKNYYEDCTSLENISFQINEIDELANKQDQNFIDKDKIQLEDFVDVIDDTSMETDVLVQEMMNVRNALLFIRTGDEDKLDLINCLTSRYKKYDQCLKQCDKLQNTIYRCIENLDIISLKIQSQPDKSTQIISTVKNLQACITKSSIQNNQQQQSKKADRIDENIYINLEQLLSLSDEIKLVLDNLKNLGHIQFQENRYTQKNSLNDIIPLTNFINEKEEPNLEQFNIFMQEQFQKNDLKKEVQNKQNEQGFFAIGDQIECRRIKSYDVLLKSIITIFLAHNQKPTSWQIFFCSQNSNLLDLEQFANLAKNEGKNLAKKDQKPLFLICSFENLPILAQKQFIDLLLEMYEQKETINLLITYVGNFESENSMHILQQFKYVFQVDCQLSNSELVRFSNILSLNSISIHTSQYSDFRKTFQINRICEINQQKCVEIPKYGETTKLELIKLIKKKFQTIDKGDPSKNLSTQIIFLIDLEIFEIIDNPNIKYEEIQLSFQYLKNFSKISSFQIENFEKEDQLKLYLQNNQINKQEAIQLIKDHFLYQLQDNFSFYHIICILQFFCKQVVLFHKTIYLSIENLNFQQIDKSLREKVFEGIIKTSVPYSYQIMSNNILSKEQEINKENLPYFDTLDQRNKNIKGWDENDNLDQTSDFFLTISQSGSILPIFKKIQSVPRYLLDYCNQLKSKIQDWNDLQNIRDSVLINLCTSTKNIKRVQQQLTQKYSDIAITKTIARKICFLFIKINNNIPTLIMGETGIGKTIIVKYLSSLINSVIFTLDVHAGLTQNEIIKWIINELDQELLGDPDNYNLKHEKDQTERDQQENNDLLKISSYENQQISKLVYHVFPLAESMNTFIWHFGELLPEDETKIVSQMVQNASQEVNKQKINFQQTLIQTITGFQQFCRMKKSNRSVNPAWNKDLSDSLLLTVFFTYYCRFNSIQLRDELCCYLENEKKVTYEGLKLNFSQNIRKIVNEQMELIQGILEQGDLYKSIAFTSTLKENLFMILISVMNNIPVIMVGPPGSSKTQCTRLLYNSMKGSKSKIEFFKKLPNLIYKTYQCSILSTSESIEKAFKSAKQIDNTISILQLKKNIYFQIENQIAKQKKEQKNIVALILDEIGLAEASKQNLLKVLHRLLEYQENVPMIGLSNWSLDASKMNRVVFSNRPKLSEEELIEAAIALQQRINPKSEYCQNIVINLAKDSFSYFSQDNTKTFFHGTRDFYNCVTLICNNLKINDEQLGNSGQKIILTRILRNFGGQKNINETLSYFKQSLGQNAQQLYDLNINLYNPTELIQMSINDKNCRNLMIIANKPDYALQYTEILCKDRLYKVFQGSYLYDDFTEYKTLKMLNEITTCMEEGYLVIMYSLESLYQSFYDLFNQNYVELGAKNFCRISIGSDSIRSQVHDNFKAIIIAQSNDAYDQKQNDDPPLLNRFENSEIKSDRRLQFQWNFGVQDMLPIIQNDKKDEFLFSLTLKNNDENDDFKRLINSQYELVDLVNFSGIVRAHFLKILDYKFYNYYIKSLNHFNFRDILDKISKEKKDEVILKDDEPNQFKRLRENLIIYTTEYKYQYDSNQPIKQKNFMELEVKGLENIENLKQQVKKFFNSEVFINLIVISSISDSTTKLLYIKRIQKEGRQLYNLQQQLEQSEKRIKNLILVVQVIYQQTKFDGFSFDKFWQQIYIEDTFAPQNSQDDLQYYLQPIKIVLENIDNGIYHQIQQECFPKIFGNLNFEKQDFTQEDIKQRLQKYMEVFKMKNDQDLNFFIINKIIERIENKCKAISNIHSKCEWYHLVSLVDKENRNNNKFISSLKQFIQSESLAILTKMFYVAERNNIISTLMSDQLTLQQKDINQIFQMWLSNYDQLSEKDKFCDQIQIIQYPFLFSIKLQIDQFKQTYLESINQIFQIEERKQMRINGGSYEQEQNIDDQNNVTLNNKDKLNMQKNAK
ncbi:hypothetical protein ABPG72_017172 [Tetrahymena utriculariae]